VAAVGGHGVATIESEIDVGDWYFSCLMTIHHFNLSTTTTSMRLIFTIVVTTWVVLQMMDGFLVNDGDERRRNKLGCVYG
jgi:hypothetical protein